MHLLKKILILVIILLTFIIILIGISISVILNIFLINKESRKYLFYFIQNKEDIIQFIKDKKGKDW